MNYDAILLTSFGGPEGPDEVMPYLERVTAGRGVPYERLLEVSKHYLALGGVSPINSQNRELLKAMKTRFPQRGIDLPIYWANRNSKPFFNDVIKEMYANGHRKVLAWVTSAYSSYSGCRQYRENLFSALAENSLQGKMVIDKVRHYFDHPGFLGPVIEDLTHKIEELSSQGFEVRDVRVMFATHSIPDSMGETSGPPDRRSEFQAPGGAYEAQHFAASKLVMKSVREKINNSDLTWELTYQSRSGSPQIPWLEPDVNDAIRQAKKSGFKAVVVVPIGFVSDHVEVIWDLDNEAKETAGEENLKFERVRTAGVHEAFVDCIADLILERLESAPALAESKLGPWPDFCAISCCPNLRRELPTVAEASP